MNGEKQQEREFYNELVNRFFNENSYFFHCINHELDGVLNETKDVDNQIYLMLGNFFDKLVSSDNIPEELENLKQVNEFFEFVDKLEQSVSFLHENELDTERMKIEIEGLAHSMFNSALLAFQSPSTVDFFKAYLKNESAESLAEALKQASEEQIHSVDEVPSEKHENDDSFTKESKNNENAPEEFAPGRLIIPEGVTLEEFMAEEESISEQSHTSDKDIIEQEFIVEENVVSEDANLEQEFHKEFSLKETETEELSSTEPVDVESVLSDEAESLEESQGNEDEKDFHLKANFDKDVRLTGGLNNSKSIEGSSSVSGEESTISSQPDSLIPAFKEEIKQKIEELQTINNLQDISHRNWKKSIKIIDSVMMSSVIYGFEAFEQISGKSKRQITKHISAAEYEQAKPVLTNTIENLTSLLKSSDPENVNSSFVKNATNHITTSKEVELAEPNFAPLESEVQEEKKNPVKTVTEINEYDSPPTPDITKIKIPGEDDEEIHSLIAEISRESTFKRKATEPSAVQSRFEEEVIHIKETPEEDEKTFSAYKQQSELYFNVIEDALATLERQRRNKTALEDLELASNALYGLSLKLNLDPIGKFPDLILTLIKNILATNYTITEKDHALLTRGFHYFKGLGNLKDLGGNKFDEIVKAIVSFNEQVKKQAKKNVEHLNYPSSGRLGFA